MHRTGNAVRFSLPEKGKGIFTDKKELER